MRELTDREHRTIGAMIGDPFVMMGHPLTCNGGNPDFSTHHDHEVIMQLADDGKLACPECGRKQTVEPWGEG